jgi:hypothetical protein
VSYLNRTMPADTMVMLDLLHEAGTEAVTLDELGVAGVRDPARALLELELAGHHIQRVLSRARPGADVECVRLAPAIDLPAPADEPPTAELALPAAPAPAPAPRSMTGAAMLGLVLLVLTALLARRS